MEREGAAVTCDGRLFHRRAAATGNALSPTVDRRVRRTSRDVDEAERGRYPDSVSTGRRCSSPVRYSYPCRPMTNLSASVDCTVEQLTAVLFKPGLEYIFGRAFLKGFTIFISFLHVSVQIRPTPQNYDQ